MTSSIILVRTSMLFVLAIGLLSACAPPPATMNSGNLTQEIRRVKSTLSAQQQTIAELSRQVASLENQLQLQTQGIEQLRQTNRTGSTYIPQPGHDTVETSQPTGEHSPTEVYLQAFGDYASGRYQAAIRGFETFLQRFPNNSYSANAQFWLGECYFNQQQYPRAIQEFEKVLQGYPRAAKSPDALLKIATAQLQLGEADLARRSIEILKQRYPKSTAVNKAKDLALP